MRNGFLIWIDYAILTIICISALLGLMRGLIQEAFSLISWIAALWVGLHYYPALAMQLQLLIPHPSIRVVAAFAALFLTTVILGKVVGYLIGSLIDRSLLRGFNRLGGLLFGGARGLLLILILILMADVLELSHLTWWRQSRFLPPLERWAQILAYQHKDYLGRVQKRLILQD